MIDPSTISSHATATVAAEPPGLLDLTVIIVNYNVREHLEQALRSVERAKAELSIEVKIGRASCRERV